MDQNKLQELCEQLHEEACARGDTTYIDPISHYPVFTRINHLQRGLCCTSGCRHCPYGFIRPTTDEAE